MRGKPIVGLVGARTAEAIVPAIEPDDRYPGRRPPENCRRRGIEMSPKSARPFSAGENMNAIGKQSACSDERGASRRRVSALLFSGIAVAEGRVLAWP